MTPPRTTLLSASSESALGMGMLGKLDLLVRLLACISSAQDRRWWQSAMT